MKEKISLGSIQIYKPRQIVYDLLEYKKSGDVLDLGSGPGRHSLFLAYQGFSVEAVELNEDKVNSLNHRAKELGLDIKTEQEDVRLYQYKKKYDVILNLMVLHFFSKEEIGAVIQKMQDNTKEGGINVISAYSDKNSEGLRPYLFQRDEIKNLYNGWKIVQDKEVQNLPAGSSDIELGQKNWSIELIAQKVSPLPRSTGKNMFKGIIIKQSLTDEEILHQFKILKTETGQVTGWQILEVEGSKESINTLSEYIKDGTWYAHFWNDKDFIAVFKNKVIKEKAEAVKYGQSIGISEEQLDFPTE